jgi:hypothetical protein
MSASTYTQFMWLTLALVVLHPQREKMRVFEVPAGPRPMAASWWSPVLAFLLTACHPTLRPPASSCELPVERELLQVEKRAPSEQHWVADFPDEAWLFHPAPEFAEGAALRAFVAQKLGHFPSQAELLARQAPIMRAAGFVLDAENDALLASGGGGTLAPITCLEALGFRYQAARWPMTTHPTEFGAFVTRGNGRVHLILSSLDRAGLKLRPEVVARVQRDRATGMTVVAHLHNHNFMFDRVVGDRLFTTEKTLSDIGGGLAPSSTDTQFYRNQADLDLQEAWVTNGFETSHWTKSQRDRLHGAP